MLSLSFHLPWFVSDPEHIDHMLGAGKDLDHFHVIAEQQLIVVRTS